MKENYWDFKEYKKIGIHASIRYPGTMIAPMQNAIIKNILKKTQIKNMLDPFHGSGTTLYEMREIVNEVIGVDINPYAHLVTHVKLNGVSTEIEKNIASLLNYIELNKNLPYNHYFKNISKWFRADIINELSIIRHSIKMINNRTDRMFFWCMFSEIIKKYSNTRNSTFKLHIEPEEKIENKENHVINDFKNKLLDFKYFDGHKNPNLKVKLFVDDSKAVLKNLEHDSVDLVITSPPYGDNQTTITYGQYSSLPLYWIEKSDLDLKCNQLENYSKIDTLSLGGQKNISRKNYDIFLKSKLEMLDLGDKKLKVKIFLEDYYEVLESISTITKKYIVMTLGNRTVNGVEINLLDFTESFFLEYGWKTEEVIERNIQNKVIPRKVSNVNGKSVNSMSKEYVLIMNRR